MEQELIKNNLSFYDTKDIYYKVDKELVSKGYWSFNDNDKVELVLNELKEYTLDKFSFLNIKKDLSVNEIFEVLNNKLPSDIKENLFIPYVHYLNSIISSMQGRYSILWWSDKETTEINLSMNDEGYYDKLTTNMETPSYEVLSFMLDVFQNRLFDKNIENAKVLLDRKNK